MASFKHKQALQVDDVPDKILRRIRRKVEKYVARGWKVDDVMGRRIAAPDWYELQKQGAIGFDVNTLYKRAMETPVKKEAKA